MKRPDLLMTLLARHAPRAPAWRVGDIVIEGDAVLYAALVGLIEPLTPNFPIVTP